MLKLMTWKTQLAISKLLHALYIKLVIPIFKLVYSTTTNGSYTTANNLVIVKAEVNDGAAMKKF